MHLNSLKIKNFLSFKDSEITFDKFSNIVHIKGTNLDKKPPESSGAGKSAIIEAIYFALFGKTLRKTTSDTLQNLYTKGKCEVTLVVNDNVVIRRIKKPPKLVVVADGENMTQESIASTQKTLDRILNTNSSVFLASMMFGQNNITNFITASPEEKRVIIQNFLDISSLFRNRDVIRDLKSGYLSEKKIKVSLFDESLSTERSIESDLTEALKLQNKASTVLSPDKLKYVGKFTLSEMREKDQEKHDLDLECRNLEMNLTNTQKTIERISGSIDSCKQDVCDNCGCILSTSRKRIDALEEERNQLTVVRGNLRKNIKVLNKRIDSIQIPISVADFSLIEEIKNIGNKVTFLQDRLKEQQLVTKKYSDDVELAGKKYEIMKFWEMAFSEQGLIKYVIKNIIEFFNERVNYYLNILSNGDFILEFNDSLEESVYAEDRLVFFDTLSGGEKKRISLSVMLGLNDLLILTGKERSNVIFFDEVADSLGDKGIKAFFDLVKELSLDKKIFIITHESYLVSLLEDTSDVLSVVKQSGVTKITPHYYKQIR